MQQRGNNNNNSNSNSNHHPNPIGGNPRNDSPSNTPPPGLRGPTGLPQPRASTLPQGQVRAISGSRHRPSLTASLPRLCLYLPLSPAPYFSLSPPSLPLSTSTSTSPLPPLPHFTPLDARNQLAALLRNRMDPPGFEAGGGGGGLLAAGKDLVNRSSSAPPTQAALMQNGLGGGQGGGYEVGAVLVLLNRCELTP